MKKDKLIQVSLPLGARTNWKPSPTKATLHRCGLPDRWQHLHELNFNPLPPKRSVCVPRANGGVQSSRVPSHPREHAGGVVAWHSEKKNLFCSRQHPNWPQAAFWSTPHSVLLVQSNLWTLATLQDARHLLHKQLVKERERRKKKKRKWLHSGCDGSCKMAPFSHFYNYYLMGRLRSWSSVLWCLRSAGVLLAQVFHLVTWLKLHLKRLLTSHHRLQTTTTATTGHEHSNGDGFKSLRRDVWV